MGTELYINGEPTEYEEDRTISEVKQDAGFPADDIVVYSHGDDKQVTVSDQDTVDHIPDGARVASQPQRGRIFGTGGR